jgi:hypothetical protein
MSAWSSRARRPHSPLDAMTVAAFRSIGKPWPLGRAQAEVGCKSSTASAA